MPLFPSIWLVFDTPLGGGVSRTHMHPVKPSDLRDLHQESDGTWNIVVGAVTHPPGMTFNGISVPHGQSWNFTLTYLPDPKPPRRGCQLWRPPQFRHLSFD